MSAMSQYVAVAAIFSHGAPWKRLALSNVVFSGWLAIVAVSSIAMFLWQEPWVYSTLGLQILPLEWNVRLLGLSAGSFASYFLLVIFLQVCWCRGTFQHAVQCSISLYLT